jgi:hypothetical protein
MAEALEKQFREAEAKRVEAEQRNLAYLQTQSEYFKLHTQTEVLFQENTVKLQDLIGRQKELFAVQQKLNSLLILEDEKLAELEKVLADKLASIKV